MTKELQDAMQQLDAIRHEIRSVSLINPGPMTRKLMENLPEPTPNHSGNIFCLDIGLQATYVKFALCISLDLISCASLFVDDSSLKKSEEEQKATDDVAKVFESSSFCLPH